MFIKKYSLFFLMPFFLMHLSHRAQVSFVLTNSVCAFDTVGLTTNLNGYPATTFSWVSLPTGAVFSAPTQSVSNLSFTNAGTYSITFMASVGNSTSYASHTIQVHPKPQILITASAGTICSGQNATLVATGADTYTWIPSLGFIIAYGGTAHVTPGVTSIYSVSGSNGFGCYAEATYTVVYSSLPTLATLTTASAVCSGYNATITAFGANSFMWKSTQFLNPIYQQSISVAPGTFSLIGSNGGTCRDSLIVNIGLLPPLDLSIHADRTLICTDGGDTLVPIILTASGATNYEWRPYELGRMTFSIGTVTAITPTISTCYTLTGFSPNCIGSSSLCIQVQTCEGVDEKNRHLLVEIYPNPVKEFLTVNLTDLDSGIIELWDIFGNCLIKHKVELNNDYKVIFNFTEYPNSLYFLKIINQEQLVYSAKIIKN